MLCACVHIDKVTIRNPPACWMQMRCMGRFTLANGGPRRLSALRPGVSLSQVLCLCLCMSNSRGSRVRRREGHSARPCCKLPSRTPVSPTLPRPCVHTQHKQHRAACYRYLWTDAFGVCAYLSLYYSTGDSRCAYWGEDSRRQRRQPALLFRHPSTTRAGASCLMSLLNPCTGCCSRL